MESRVAWLFAGLAIAAATASGPLCAAKPPSPAAVKMLQRLAEQQGHPRAAARDLKNLDQPVPKEIEAAAAGVKGDAMRRAAEQPRPLAARLETARGRKFSPEQSQRIVAAEQEHLRQVQSLRAAYYRAAAKATGLPEAKLQQELARDQGEPDRERQVLAQLETLLGRRLTAGQAHRVRDAREAFRDAIALQRDAFAVEVGKLSGVPSRVVKELLP